MTWNEGSNTRELKSEIAILEARDNGELSFEEAGVIVNCPFVKWNGSHLQLRDNSYVTDADSYGGDKYLILILKT